MRKAPEMALVIGQRQRSAEIVAAIAANAG
jgi:hypothetical protein